MPGPRVDDALLSCAQTRLQTGGRGRAGSGAAPFSNWNLEAAGWQGARRLAFADFEDAVVATVAKATESVFIITRNVGDFAGSPVPAITPADFLSQLATAV